MNDAVPLFVITEDGSHYTSDTKIKFVELDKKRKRLTVQLENYVILATDFVISTSKPENFD